MAKQDDRTAASDAVRKSQKKNEIAGGGRFPTLTLNPEEMAVWESLLAKDKGQDRGKAKRTLMNALRLAAGKGETDWPAELRRLANWIEGGPK